MYLCIFAFVYLCVCLPLEKTKTRKFHLLCRLLGHLALEHEVLEDVRLEHQLERLRGSLGSKEPVCVQLFRLQSAKVDVQWSRCFNFRSPRGT